MLGPSSGIFEIRSVNLDDCGARTLERFRAISVFDDEVHGKALGFGRSTKSWRTIHPV